MINLRIMRVLFALPTICVALSACAPTVDQPPVAPAQPPVLLQPCGADAQQSLIGATYEQLLKTEILGPVRTIRPGDVVTEDFRPNRLNIALTQDDRVASVYCG